MGFRNTSANYDWAECFLEFFEQIDATFTFRALALEANIFQKPIHIQRLILALEKLVLSINKCKAALQNIDEKVEWLHGPQPLQNEEQSKQESFSGGLKRKVENLARNVVQDSSSNEQIFDRMESFISTQRTYINESNNQEFLAIPKGKNISCARINANPINRGVQIQRDIVDNSADFNTYSRVDSKGPIKTKGPDRFSGLEERLVNIETHLNVDIQKKEKFSVYERVSVLEERIMQLERDFPEISRINFIQPGRKNLREKDGRTRVSKVANKVQIKFPKINNDKKFYSDLPNNDQHNIHENLAKPKQIRLNPRKRTKFPKFYSAMSPNNAYYNVQKLSTKILAPNAKKAKNKPKPIKSISASMTSAIMQKLRENQEKLNLV